MAQTRFTNATLQKLQPGDWTDPRYPNLVFRVGKRARTWMFRLPRRADGSRPGVKIGRFPDLNLAFAVKRYEEERARRARGELPPDPEERIRELEAELQALKRATGKLTTFGHLVERFIRDYVPKTGRPLAPVTHAGYRQVLEDYALPLWAAIDSLVEVKEGQARALLKVMKMMFTWGTKKKIVSVNPCSNIVTIPQKPRSRVLSPEEIQAAWYGFPERGDTVGRVLRFLLLSLQRLTEVVAVV